MLKEGRQKTRKERKMEGKRTLTPNKVKKKMEGKKKKRNKGKKEDRKEEMK